MPRRATKISMRLLPLNVPKISSGETSWRRYHCQRYPAWNPEYRVPFKFKIRPSFDSMPRQDANGSSGTLSPSTLRNRSEEAAVATVGHSGLPPESNTALLLEP